MTIYRHDDTSQVLVTNGHFDRNGAETRVAGEVRTERVTVHCAPDKHEHRDPIIVDTAGGFSVNTGPRVTLSAELHGDSGDVQPVRVSAPVDGQVALSTRGTQRLWMADEARVLDSYLGRRAVSERPPGNAVRRDVTSVTSDGAVLEIAWSEERLAYLRLEDTVDLDCSVVEVPGRYADNDTIAPATDEQWLQFANWLTEVSYQAFLRGETVVLEHGTSVDDFGTIATASSVDDIVPMIELTLLDSNALASFDPPPSTRTPATNTTLANAGLSLQRIARMWATSPLETTISFRPTPHPASWTR